jgi:hypothetical protein
MGLASSLDFGRCSAYTIGPFALEEGRMAVMVLALAGALLSSGPLLAASLDWQITTLSGRPDMVTGGDALIQVTGPKIAESARRVRVTLNGSDVSAAFRAGRTKGSLIGRTEGLRLGRNRLEVALEGKLVAKVDLVNHPIAGPVFSGPHQKPFVCETEAAGLGPALDADCSAKTVVTYVYRSTNPVAPAPAGTAPTPSSLPPGFKPYDPAGPRPPDLAQTTTTEGQTVDHIVRLESGTINRAIYSIAFLHRPTEPLPDPWTSSPGWNGRLVFFFGGGCRAGYHQSRAPSAANAPFVAQGYASATSSLNVFGNDCNDVISAETLMMVKEHFIERFGLPLYTIGSGASGGSMQQHLIAQNYPGLLDGILPSLSYPDIVTLVPPVLDCALLDHAFQTAQTSWTDDQKAAVSGYATWKTCVQFRATFSPGWIQPGSCTAQVPKGQVYDPVTNPKGARCGLYDNQVNVFGRDPKTGFARQPLDNVGVQYGLVAFNTGRIDAEQFLDLNARAGGYDADGNIVADRMQADREALRLAYRTGRVNAGTGALASIPIIDVRNYRDPAGDIHDRVRSVAMRARLIAANGRADNHVILTLPNTPASGVDASSQARMNVQQTVTLTLMDRWLANIVQDRSPGSAAQKTARNRPPELVDACWNAQGEKITEPQAYDGTGECNRLYPNHGDPRVAAGAPFAGNILKCALKPVAPKDYAHPLGAGQLARVRAIFPLGVCDYSRPAVEQQKADGSWRRY